MLSIISKDLGIQQILVSWKFENKINIENNKLFDNYLNILKNNLNKYNKYIEFIQTEEGKLEW